MHGRSLASKLKPVMGSQAFLVLGLLLLLVSASSVTSQEEGLCGCTDKLSRQNYSADFVFGTAASAYQYEGAAFLHGKGPSIWDNFTHQYPDEITDGSNGDVAIDSYNRYKGDSCMMSAMGLDAYRFSISWSRILPRGNLSGGLNTEGIQYYNDLIDDLLAKGIQPYVTLFHWDVPQALEDEYGGFLSPQIVNDFRDFADICFWKFGDRVKHWITLNEPWSFSTTGYGYGTYAPGRCSAWQNCTTNQGNSSTEPYLVTHHQLLAHAAAAQLYRQRYQPYQNGMIGITIVSIWYEPLNQSSLEDVAAQKRALDFMYGWFMDPLTRGDYPYNMRNLVGSRLPNFTTEESTMLIRSFDFLGLNYYTASYATDDNETHLPSYIYDSKVKATYYRNGVPIGENASSWQYIYPQGLRGLLEYTKETYDVSLIYITENGVNDEEKDDTSLFQALVDIRRVKFLRDHLCCLHKSIYEDDVNVKGYFVWSMMDNFEWVDGYTSRMGINYVDYEHNLTRYPKQSAIWYQAFLNGNTQSTELKLIADQ